MSLILNIDTSSERAHVSIANNGEIIGVLYNEVQKEHASFLQTAVQELSKSTGIQLNALDAIAVTEGPGSYTGLRVGMSGAKGLAYALQKPFITLNSLEVLASSALLSNPTLDTSILLCPMMDARRMEVFTGIYTTDLKLILEPCALILDEHSYKNELKNNEILFFGSGSSKWKAVCLNANAKFFNVEILPESMNNLTNKKYLKKSFTELAYSEPLYLKEFQSFTK